MFQFLSYVFPLINRPLTVFIIVIKNGYNQLQIPAVKTIKILKQRNVFKYAV